jgi:hypothetical protein
MAQKRWFEGNPEELSPVVRKCEGLLSTQRFIDGCCNRIYFGEPLMLGATATASANPAGIPRASTLLRGLQGLSQENLLKSVIEAQSSMVVRKPAFKVITSGSTWKKQIASRRASRLLSGIFSTSGLEAATPAIYRDSKRCIVAASKWTIDETGAVRCERALPHTISFNPGAGPQPREIFQHHGVPRTELVKRYPQLEGKADKLPTYRPDPAFHAAGTASTAYTTSDDVDVVEGWRVPKGNDPGRYVLVCGGEVLEDEPWDLPVTPLVILTDGDSYDSLAGTPLARDLLPFQQKLERMEKQLQENIAKCSNPRIAVPIGADVKVPFTSTMAEVFPYNAAGGQVTWLPGQMLPGDFYQEKQRTKDAAFAQAGVSQSVAQSTKTPGLNSGKAQREEYDRASGRLVLDAEKLERWFERNAMTALALMRRAYLKY